MCVCVSVCVCWGRERNVGIAKHLGGGGMYIYVDGHLSQVWKPFYKLQL